MRRGGERLTDTGSRSPAPPAPRPSTAPTPGYVAGALAVLAMLATMAAVTLVGRANRLGPVDATGIVGTTGVGDALRLRIVLSERQLYEYRGDEVVATDPVAVGKPGHATPTGSWGIHQVDWNPDWTPPDSEWAEHREPPSPPATPGTPWAGSA